VVAKCKGENVPHGDYKPEIFAVLDAFTEEQRNAIINTGNLICLCLQFGIDAFY